MYTLVNGVWIAGDSGIDSYVHNIDNDEAARIRRFLLVVAIGTVAFVVVTIALVITVPQWIGIVSHESERRFAEPHVNWVNDHLLSIVDGERSDYVTTLGESLAAEMDVPDDLELSFYVVDGDSPNGFATLGGHIYIVDSLIAELDNENSLAMVLAHEIGHAVNRDPLTGTGRGVLIQVMVSALSGGGFDPSTTADFGVEMTLNSYSRQQEERADTLALHALNRYYGHIGGAEQLFESLLSGTALDDIPTFMSSHPQLEDRIAAIDRAAEENGWARGETTPYPPEVTDALSWKL